MPLDRVQLYELLQKETAVDSAADSDTYDFYRSLFPNFETKVFDEPLVSLSAEALGRALDGGISYQSYKDRSLIFLRKRTIFYLTESKSEIISKLDDLETKYFRRISRYRKHPVITFKALTEPKVRRQRLEVLGSFRPIDRLDQSNVLDVVNWADDVRNYLESLEKLKTIITAMSEDMVAWQKYIGDVWRLNTAVISLILAIIGLFGFRFYDYFKGSHVISMVGTCAPVYEPFQLKCSFEAR